MLYATADCFYRLANVVSLLRKLFERWIHARLFAQRLLLTTATPVHPTTVGRVNELARRTRHADESWRSFIRRCQLHSTDEGNQSNDRCDRVSDAKCVQCA